MENPAFEALYRELEKPLYNAAYRWLWNEEEAMDMVQEAFMKLLATRAPIHGEAVKPYLFRTVLNLASNRLRTRKLWKWTGLEGLFSKAVHPEERMIEDEREQQVRRAVEALPEKIRKVVVLVRFAEMSYREIGRVLGIPEGTVGSRYNKGIELIERKLTRPKERR